jgi:hypothetical protein
MPRNKKTKEEIAARRKLENQQYYEKNKEIRWHYKRQDPELCAARIAESYINRLSPEKRAEFLALGGKAPPVPKIETESTPEIPT